MRNSLLLLGLVSVAGCGKKAEAATTEVVKADSSAAKTDSAKAPAHKAVAVAKHGQKFDTAAAAGNRPLVRETFHYEAATLRDPFRPLVQETVRGPELPDLRLVAILYDDRSPSESIATFRDIGDDKRYTLSPGQRIGRISMVEVTPTTVKLREDDFGTARDQTYSLRKPGDEKP